MKLGLGGRCTQPAKTHHAPRRALVTVSPPNRGTSEYAGRVIPTLLLVGLVLGRWWRVVIPVAAIGWAVLLIATGVDSGPSFAVAAALLGAVNVAVGVVVFQAGRLFLRSLFMSRGEAAKP